MDLKITLFFLAIGIVVFFYKMARRDQKYVRILGIIGVIYSLIYFSWRMGFTIPKEGIVTFILACVLLFNELVGLLQATIFKILFSSNGTIPQPTYIAEKDLPTIDVFIATYNEPISILERTVVGCKNIDYPQERLNVYLCDDGSRKEAVKLAEKYAIHYLTRSNKQHAKAGNINNALQHSEGNLVLLLDADMIPKRQILRKMVGYFVDEKMGFVQCPQVFYNLDPFQYNLNINDEIPNEQDFFMRTIEEKRALYNAVLHVGTNALFSRKALDSIGGIPTGSITEDMATGMLLQAKGYRSVFLNEALAVGLSAETFEDLIKQRDRWSRGNLQVARKYNPLAMKGLSWIQKIIYFDGCVYWFFGVQKLVFIIAPMVYLLTGLNIFLTNGFDLLFFFIPFYLSTILYFSVVTNNSRNITWTHIYEVALAPYLAFSVFMEMLLKNTSTFKVTPKGKTSDKNKFRLGLAIPHIILLFLNIVCWGKAYLIIQHSSFIYWVPLFINLAWSVYNSFGLAISILLANEKTRYRSSERVSVDLPARLHFTDFNKMPLSCSALDISERGARLIVNEGLPEFFKTGLTIDLDMVAIGKVRAEIAWAKDTIGNIEIGLKFIDIPFEVFCKINELRFDMKNKYLGLVRLNKRGNLLIITWKVLSDILWGKLPTKKSTTTRYIYRAEKHTRGEFL